MKPDSLQAWLDYQQQVHHQGVELGLDRVRRVWHRMGSPSAPLSILVGGTNGKGSTVAFLEAMLRAAGHRVGAYTSPHLLRYNERVRIDGEEATDDELCGAFERIEDARGDTALTYFEFGTLAALDLFAGTGVEVAILEVGLGGRLDATNIVDADVAIVTTVDMDHMDWLGDTRDAIGVEKAGIARRDRPVVIGETDPPAGLLDALRDIGAKSLRAGSDFHALDGNAPGRWRWQSGDVVLDLPDPGLEAPCQRDNAAAAIAALHALRERLPWSPASIAEGMIAARLGGRLQRLRSDPEVIVDVAHNPQAARVLASWLQEQPRRGRLHAVFGALADKDIAGVLQIMAPLVDHWYLADLDGETPRGLPAEAVAMTLAAVAGSVPHSSHADVGGALDAARAAAAPEDRILAFGSFFVVAPALDWAAPPSQRALTAAV